MTRSYMPVAPHPHDQHVGRRIRLRRIELEVTQERLAEALNVSVQQVQKYERGTNRIGANRLYEVCCILDVPVSFFFASFDLVRAPRQGQISIKPTRISEAVCPLT